jgi:hypothetical protein
MLVRRITHLTGYAILAPVLATLRPLFGYLNFGVLVIILCHTAYNMGQLNPYEWLGLTENDSATCDSWARCLGETQTEILATYRSVLQSDYKQQAVSAAHIIPSFSCSSRYHIFPIHHGPFKSIQCPRQRTCRAVRLDTSLVIYTSN